MGGKAWGEEAEQSPQQARCERPGPSQGCVCAWLRGAGRGAPNHVTRGSSTAESLCHMELERAGPGRLSGCPESQGFLDGVHCDPRTR